MSKDRKTQLTRREMLATAGKAGVAAVVASPFVHLAYADGGVFVQAVPAALNVVAGHDRVVMTRGRTYLSAWAGYGQPPRRDRRRTAQEAGAAEQSPAAVPKVTWSRLSGPGDVAFADRNAAVTTATFSAAGDYVLQAAALAVLLSLLATIFLAIGVGAILQVVWEVGKLVAKDSVRFVSGSDPSRALLCERADSPCSATCRRWLTSLRSFSFSLFAWTRPRKYP